VTAVGVVGHVELVEFARVHHVPRSGEIVHASSTWETAAGGGAVAAVELAELAGGADFFTGLGADDAGERALRSLASHPGLRLHAGRRQAAQRRVLTFVEPSGERTITVLGPRMGPLHADPLPWDALAGLDGVYFTAGDADALRAARAAAVLVATPRARETLLEAHVQIDALVLSARDAGEQLDPASLNPPPRHVVRTLGSEGGEWEAAGGESGSWAAVAPPGPIADTYGAGDCFAAGLTFALARGDGIQQAVELGAQRGAACLTRDGPHGS
jgi:ribokinase